MMHHPEQHFPPHVKTILMSQSDFDLPNPKVATLDAPKKYDFTYAATWPLGPQPDSVCDGWSGYCKNWSFVKEALHVLCGEKNLTGVLVATRDKNDPDIACEIPASCEGKITQTTFIDQVRGVPPRSPFLLPPFPKENGVSCASDRPHRGGSGQRERRREREGARARPLHLLLFRYCI